MHSQENQHWHNIVSVLDYIDSSASRSCYSEECAGRNGVFTFIPPLQENTKARKLAISLHSHHSAWKSNICWWQRAQKHSCNLISLPTKLWRISSQLSPWSNPFYTHMGRKKINSNILMPRILTYQHPAGTFSSDLLFSPSSKTV